MNPKENSINSDFVPVSKLLKTGLISRTKFYQKVNEKQVDLYKLDRKSYVRQEQIDNLFVKKVVK